jgi:hypothetical protein
MKNVMKAFIAVIVFVFSFSAYTQETQESLGKKIDDITFAWDLESDNLDTYDGMLKFCTNREYRLEVIGMLHDIHHYDSVLLERLNKAARFNKTKELEKTLKDIQAFEQEYSMKEFIQFLFDECQGISDIERHKKDLLDELGEESYDGKRYTIETEIAKYIHHITKRVDTIREHVHHLHID